MQGGGAGPAAWDPPWCGTWLRPSPAWLRGNPHLGSPVASFQCDSPTPPPQGQPAPLSGAVSVPQAGALECLPPSCCEFVDQRVAAWFPANWQVFLTWVILPVDLIPSHGTFWKSPVLAVPSSVWVCHRGLTISGGLCEHLVRTAAPHGLRPELAEGNRVRMNPGLLEATTARI